MSSRFFIVISIILLLVLVPMAESKSKEQSTLRDNISISSGYRLSATGSVDDGLAAVIGGNVFISEKINLNASVIGSFLTSGFSSAGYLSELGSGNLSTMEVSVSICYNLPLSKSFNLYVLSGVGSNLSSFSAEDNYEVLGYAIEENLDTFVSFHFGGGFDLAISRGMALNLEARYRLAEPTGSWSIVDNIGGSSMQGDTETDMTHLLFTLGLKIFLNNEK